MRPDVGYVQGMSYIVGMLLLYMDSFQAYLILMNLAWSWILMQFFTANNCRISKIFQIFKNILL